MPKLLGFNFLNMFTRRYSYTSYASYPYRVYSSQTDYSAYNLEKLFMLKVPLASLLSLGSSTSKYCSKLTTLGIKTNIFNETYIADYFPNLKNLIIKI